MRLLRTTFSFLALMTLLLGAAYPAAVWTVGRLFFHEEAVGSLVFRKGHLQGSTLIGQLFESDEYFKSRPSATAVTPYNFMASGGSNLNPTNKALLEDVKMRALHIQQENGSDKPVPVDLVTSSGSGLDPHISLNAALYQVERIAKQRNLYIETVRKLVLDHAEYPTFGFIGEPRVNVLLLNLSLDVVSPPRRGKND